MKNKKKSLLWIIIAALLAASVAGCAYTRMRNMPTPAGARPAEDAALSPAPAVSDRSEAYFNPYNYGTVSDGKDVYYTLENGLYKIPGGASGAEKILNGEDGDSVTCLALHGEMIYYLDGGELFRCAKDGSGRTEIGYPDGLTYVACLNDTLYVCDSKVHYTADIAGDPDEPIFIEHYRGRPAPNGEFYRMESGDVMGSVNNLYHINFDTGKATELLHGLSNAAYIVTDRYIFYCDDSMLCRSSLDGTNTLELVEDPEGLGWNSLFFRNFDEQHLYLYINRIGLCRMDQETGAYEPLRFDANGGTFDVVDGYFYGRHDREKVRKKLPDGPMELAPFLKTGG